MRPTCSEPGELTGKASAEGPGVREKHQHSGREQAPSTGRSQAGRQASGSPEETCRPRAAGGPAAFSRKSPDSGSEPETPSRVTAETAHRSRWLLRRTCWRETARVAWRRRRRRSTGPSPRVALCTRHRRLAARLLDGKAGSLPALPPSLQLQVHWTEATCRAPFNSEGSTAPSVHIHQDPASPRGNLGGNQPVLTGPCAPHPPRAQCPPAPSAESSAQADSAGLTRLHGPRKRPRSPRGHPQQSSEPLDPAWLRGRGDARVHPRSWAPACEFPPMSRELSQPASLSPASTPRSSVTALPGGPAGASGSLLVLWSGGNQGCWHSERQGRAGA